MFQRVLRPAWSQRHGKPVRGLMRCHEVLPSPSQELPAKHPCSTRPLLPQQHQQGCKLVNDQLLKARQRLHRAGQYRRGIDDWACNQPMDLIVSKATPSLTNNKLSV